jgi:hypothetical protein
MSSKMCRKNKKPAGLAAPDGLKSVLISELLSTPQRARQMAVMMMVAMSVGSESHKPTE